jgi:hypothetical protein
MFKFKHWKSTMSTTNTSKVSILDQRIRKIFWEKISLISALFTIGLAFLNIPQNLKFYFGIAFLVLCIFLYLKEWLKANNLDEIKLDIEGSTVIIKAGDIFAQDGLKAIAFNEYFDTQVDEKIISSKSLNGMFLKTHLDTSIETLDEYIQNYDYEEEEKIQNNSLRTHGKKLKYAIGTTCVYDEYLLTAFSKFDEKNRAHLTMPEYLGFLITFWDKVNKVYAQKSVSVPIFGSGITRIKEHRSISDEELLKIMLWTFRISEMRFKYPAKLTIVIHRDKIDQINLMDVSLTKRGL